MKGTGMSFKIKVPRKDPVLSKTVKLGREIPTRNRKTVIKQAKGI